MSDFDPNWPHGHTTRDGSKARIICMDAAGPFKLIALKTCAGDFGPFEITISRDLRGRLSALFDSDDDLLNATAPALFAEAAE